MVSIVEIVLIGVGVSILGGALSKGVSNYRERKSSETSDNDSEHNINFGGRSRRNLQRKNKSRRR
jgi:hypothetical protein